MDDQEKQIRKSSQQYQSMKGTSKKKMLLCQFTQTES